MDRCPGVHTVGDPRREGVSRAGQQHRILGGQAGSQEVFAIAAIPLAEEGAEGEEEGDPWDISRPFPGDILGEVAVSGLGRPGHPQHPEMRVVGLEAPANARSFLKEVGIPSRRRQRFHLAQAWRDVHQIPIYQCTQDIRVSNRRVLEGE